mmetsp:Transcript_36420/g.74761  ORF Transcript_36420/g.74761 Transcript_36420/m.74761 type:complete len:717 (-) Transcript_36420:207-2357(-)
MPAKGGGRGRGGGKEEAAGIAARAGTKTVAQVSGAQGAATSANNSSTAAAGKSPAVANAYDSLPSSSEASPQKSNNANTESDSSVATSVSYFAAGVMNLLGRRKQREEQESDPPREQAGSLGQTKSSASSDTMQPKKKGATAVAQALQEAATQDAAQLQKPSEKAAEQMSRFQKHKEEWTSKATMAPLHASHSSKEIYGNVKPEDLHHWIQNDPFFSTDVGLIWQAIFTIEASQVVVLMCSPPPTPNLLPFPYQSFQLGNRVTVHIRGIDFRFITNEGREELLQELRQRGWQIDDVTCITFEFLPERNKQHNLETTGAYITTRWSQAHIDLWFNGDKIADCEIYLYGDDTPPERTLRIKDYTGSKVEHNAQAGANNLSCLTAILTKAGWSPFRIGLLFVRQLAEQGSLGSLPLQTDLYRRDTTQESGFRMRRPVRADDLMMIWSMEHASEEDAGLTRAFFRSAGVSYVLYLGPNLDGAVIRVQIHMEAAANRNNALVPFGAPGTRSGVLPRHLVEVVLEADPDTVYRATAHSFRTNARTLGGIRGSIMDLTDSPISAEVGAPSIRAHCTIKEAELNVTNNRWDYQKFWLEVDAELGAQNFITLAHSATDGTGNEQTVIRLMWFASPDGIPIPMRATYLPPGQNLSYAGAAAAALTRQRPSPSDNVQIQALQNEVQTLRAQVTELSGAYRQAVQTHEEVSRTNVMMMNQMQEMANVM